MAFNLSLLTTWIEERANKEDIIIKPFLADPTMDYIQKLKDVKGQIVKLPIIEADGSTGNSFCSTADTGTGVSIKQFTIQGFFNNYRQNFCLSELDQYFATQWHQGDTLTVLDDLMNREVGLKVVKKAKDYLWLSNPTIATLPADFKRFNGFLRQIDANTPSANVFTFGAGQVLGVDDGAGTVAVTTAIQELYSRLPEDILTEDLVAFVSPQAMQFLRLKLRKDNLYHYAVEDLEINRYVMRYPAISNLVVVATSSLSNNTVTGQDNTQRDRIVMTNINNLVSTIDVEGIKNTFRVGFSEYHKQLFIDAEYWLGAGVKFFDLVTTCKRA